MKDFFETLAIALSVITVTIVGCYLAAQPASSPKSMLTPTPAPTVAILEHYKAPCKHSIFYLDSIDRRAYWFCPDDSEYREDLNR